MCCKTAEVRKYNCRFLLLCRKPRTQETLTTHQSTLSLALYLCRYLVSVSPAVVCCTHRTLTLPLPRPFKPSMRDFITRRSVTRLCCRSV